MKIHSTPYALYFPRDTCPNLINKDRGISYKHWNMQQGLDAISLAGIKFLDLPFILMFPDCHSSSQPLILGHSLGSWGVRI